MKEKGSDSLIKRKEEKENGERLGYSDAYQGCYSSQMGEIMAAATSPTSQYT
jgi:hypothetical protein